MTQSFEKFNLKDCHMLEEKLKKLDLDVPVSKDVSVLKKEIKLGNKVLKNSMAIHPMEGCDANSDGSPSDTVYRRYERLAKGGCGLLWIEACAVSIEGKANPSQLHINEDNAGKFKKFVEFVRKQAEGELYLVLQLTHSGRYAKPGDDLPAVIACRNEHLDRFLPKNVKVITDDELCELEDLFTKSAKLAYECGFDAIDIKSCHGYLSNELLSAYNREGIYGGSFENRTRFLFNIVEKIKKNVPINISVRLNSYDEIPYPDGFGAKKEDFRTPDLTEAKEIIKHLNEKGVKLVNITGGNPYYNPHVNRPYDIGLYLPPVHQLNYVYKLLNASREIKRYVPDVKVVATGLTWLRDLGANVAAGCINENWFDIAGFGRQAFAYPNFANDIKKSGMMYRDKCCITCGKCTIMMRDKGIAGCPIKDSAFYMPYYKAGRQDKPSPETTNIGESL